MFNRIITILISRVFLICMAIPDMGGESEPMDLPFSFFQIRIFRAFGLTPNEKIRYVSYIRLIPEIIPEKLIFGHLSIYLQFSLFINY